jgi:hypothetical protein
MIGNPDTIAEAGLLIISNAIICLFQSEPDTPEIGECVAEVERIIVKPDATFVEVTDTLSNAVICLSQSAPEREKCVAEVERTIVKPDAIIDTLSNAVICLART